MGLYFVISFYFILGPIAFITRSSVLKDLSGLVRFAILIAGLVLYYSPAFFIRHRPETEKGVVRWGYLTINLLCAIVGLALYYSNI